MGVQHRCLFVGTSPCPQVPCAGVLGAVGHAACDPTLGCGPWRGPGGSQTPPPSPGFKGKGRAAPSATPSPPPSQALGPTGRIFGVGGETRWGPRGAEGCGVCVGACLCVCRATSSGRGSPAWHWDCRVTGCPMAAPRAAGSSWSPRSLRSLHLRQARHHYAINQGFPQPLPHSPTLCWWHRSGDAVFPSAAESKCLRPVPAAQASNVQVFFRLCILLVAQRDGELWLS